MVLRYVGSEERDIYIYIYILPAHLEPGADHPVEIVASIGAGVAERQLLVWEHCRWRVCQLVLLQSKQVGSGSQWEPIHWLLGCGAWP